MAPRPARLVGLGGFEPPASPLSGVRSNRTELQTRLARAALGRRAPWPIRWVFRQSLSGRPPSCALALLGGDPAADSPTATLLRLHPSH